MSEIAEVYLAGPITGLSYYGATAWRRQATRPAPGEVLVAIDCGAMGDDPEHPDFDPFSRVTPWPPLPREEAREQMRETLMVFGGESPKSAVEGAMQDLCERRQVALRRRDSGESVQASDAGGEWLEEADR